MSRMKWGGLFAAAILIVACFIPWVYIESKEITITGVNATGTNFGKPGYFHLIMSAIFLAFNFIPKVWAKRSNLLVTALNLAWAVRNYFLIPACQMGDCPDKEAGIYIIVLSSLLMMITALFPDIKLPDKKETKP